MFVCIRVCVYVCMYYKVSLGDLGSIDRRLSWSTRASTSTHDGVPKSRGQPSTPWNVLAVLLLLNSIYGLSNLRP